MGMRFTFSLPSQRLLSSRTPIQKLPQRHAQGFVSMVTLTPYQADNQDAFMVIPNPTSWQSRCFHGDYQPYQLTRCFHGDSQSHQPDNQDVSMVILGPTKLTIKMFPWWFSTLPTDNQDTPTLPANDLYLHRLLPRSFVVWFCVLKWGLLSPSLTSTHYITKDDLEQSPLASTSWVSSVH